MSTLTTPLAVAGVTGAMLLAPQLAWAEPIKHARHHQAEAMAEQGMMTDKKAQTQTKQATTTPHMAKRHFHHHPAVKITSEGGIKVRDVNDRFWFKSGGTVRLDQTQFSGKSDEVQGYFPSSGNLRHADWGLKGGVGADWAYVLRVRYNRANSGRGDSIAFSDAYASYLGIADNAILSVGRLSSPFSLDNENSTSWQPFLENAIIHPFFPSAGLGLKYGMWWKHWSFKVSGVQPDHGAYTDAAGTPSPRARDRWLFAGRAIYAPLNRHGDVLHFGLGGVFQEVPYTAYDGSQISYLKYSVLPEAVSRSNTNLVALWETDPTTGVTSQNMRASLVRQYGIEFARQCGPLMGFAEYFYTNVKRPERNINPSTNPSRGSTDFHGWYLLGSWLITGESREYSLQDGEFRDIKPCSPCGAWELAARYSYISLVNKDINGGTEHNASLGLNWFYNSHVRLSLNYVRANIHPAVVYTPSKVRLNILAARAQVRW